jgi:hypothetical protein
MPVFEQFHAKYYVLNPKLRDYEDIYLQDLSRKQFSMRMKFEPGRKTYHHVLINVVLGIVELTHAALKPHQVLHRVPGATMVHHNLPVLDAEGGFSHVGSIPGIDVLLERTQVVRVAVQLDDPARLGRNLLTNNDRGSPSIKCEAL